MRKKFFTDITKRKKHYNQKYDINFSLFDNADAEEFAYFLGFFYADGYNNEKQGKVAIILKKEDEELLKNFSKLFFGGRPIFTYNISCQTNKINSVSSLIIGNKSLSNLISLYGAPQNKTFKIRFPFWLNKNLWRHFIRGYFDGDGSIMKHKNQYKISIASNLYFNRELKKIIEKSVNLKFDLRKHGKITILYKGGNNNTKIFLNWLYNDSNIFLQRKYNRYKELLLNCKKIDNTKKSYTHVYYNKQKNRWISRLPNKFGRKNIGYFKTKKEAINAYKNHPLLS